MVGSFIIFLIMLLLHMTLVSLEPKYTFLSDFTQYTMYIVIGAAVLFVIFTAIKIYKSIRK